MLCIFKEILKEILSALEVSLKPQSKKMYIFKDILVWMNAKYLYYSRYFNLSRILCFEKHCMHQASLQYIHEK